MLVESPKTLSLNVGMQLLSLLAISMLFHIGLFAQNYLPGQIITDPDHPEWMKYYGGGSFFMCGPGGPEDFFYHGSRNPDGTRNGDQMILINKMVGTGANCIWMTAWRSNGGDGGSTENPFINSNFNNGFDYDILNQWETWFDAMESNDIMIFFVFYDDASCPNLSQWNTGDNVGPEEQFYLETLVNYFGHHKNIIWCPKEEYNEKFSVDRVSNIASIIRAADDYNHPISVHKLQSLSLVEFANDPNVDQFAIQYNKTDPLVLHNGMVTAWSTANGRYNLNMSEIRYGGIGTGDAARLRIWAIAMGGAYVMLNGMDIVSTPINDLKDCGRLHAFFESVNLSKMAPHDELASGATDYVLASPDSGYILYSDGGGDLGLDGSNGGYFDLLWFDPVDGSQDTILNALLSSGTNYFTRPDSIGNEAALYLFRSGFDEPLPVTLSSFSADYKGSYISVKWRTESEIKNLGFILLRSSNNSGNYSELASYESVESMKGQGTTNAAADYFYVDGNVHPNQTYSYILQDVDYNGDKTSHGPIEISTSTSEKPNDFFLYQNYPNPFNGYTTITFSIPTGDYVTLNLYDLLGQPIDNIILENLPPGLHEIRIDGGRLSSGNYFYKLRAGNYIFSRKMQIVK